MGDLDVELFPQQTIAFNSPANEILFGGSKGPGKSTLLRIASILLCCEAPGLQAFLFRRTYPDLQKNHMEGSNSYPELLARMVHKGMVSITPHVIKFRFNGSRIFLNHLQYAKDVTKYQGQEIHLLLMDELTQFEEAQYRYLFGSVRLGSWVPPAHMRDVLPRILCGANPGGVSHSFVKQRFVDQGPYVVTRQGGMRRQFIPARAEDNPALLKNDPLYLERLEEMGDAAFVKAMRDGDWSVVAGAMFGEVWRATKHGRPWHVHPGFRIPMGWPLWRGADDGYEAPFAGYWGAEDPDRGTTYVVQELHRNHMLADEIAMRVLEMDKEIEMQDADGPCYNEEILRGALDLAAFTDTGQSDRSGQKQITRGEQMNRMGCKWEPIEKWPGSRVARAQNLHRLLAPNKKAPPMIDAATGKKLLDHDRPGIVFFARCVKAIETIPTLMRSKNNPEDVDDSGPDHCFVAGTLIETRRGSVPIERVRVGDCVQTRLGFAPVMATWEHKAPVIGNAGLIGTAPHKIFDESSMNWVYLRDWTELNMECNANEFNLMDTLLHVTQNPSTERAGFILALALQIAAKESGFCIRKSGEQRMEQYRTAMKSIIKMGTRSTIISAIWSALLRRNMLNGMTPRSAKRCSEETCVKLVRQLKNGMVQRPGANGTASTVREFTSSLNLGRSSASNAALSFEAGKFGQGFVAGTAQHNGDAKADLMTLSVPVRIVDERSPRTNTAEHKRVRDGAEPQSDIATVYNLSVCGAPEYFANGKLVSNCYDGVTYLCQYRRGRTQRVQMGGF